MQRKKEMHPKNRREHPIKWGRIAVLTAALIGIGHCGFEELKAQTNGRFDRGLIGLLKKKGIWDSEKPEAERIMGLQNQEAELAWQRIMKTDKINVQK